MAESNHEAAGPVSLLTVLLAESPESRAFHGVFVAVPRCAGGTPESRPAARLKIPRGSDFMLRAVLTGVIALMVSYVITVGIGVIASLANMAGSSCGQEVWKTSADEACNAAMMNSVVLSLELRCQADRPAAMLQKDFDEACGAASLVGFIMTVIITFAIVAHTISKKVGKMPSKVAFHKDLFAVESLSGKRFECSFYADVTSAKVSYWGLSLSTKARANVHAGGMDGTNGDKFTDGRVLKLKGDSSITIPCGTGTARGKLLQEFAKRLPVSIDGFGGQPSGEQGGASLLDGRLGVIARARKADTYESVRKPLSCDFLTEFIFVAVMILVGWYVFATISTLIGWSITKGTGKCLDPLKPDEDMCAVWRIFVPISVPITNPSDYINVVVLVCGLVLALLWYLAHMAVEQRLHPDGILQEVPLARQEFQKNTMIFASDVEAIELVEDSFEKCVKVNVKAFYTIENGISRPFTVAASFVKKEIKFGLIDADCASCSGHKPQALAHREKLFELLEKLKPGMLQTSKNASSSQEGTQEVAFSPPTQEPMP